MPTPALSRRPRFVGAVLRQLRPAASIALVLAGASSGFWPARAQQQRPTLAPGTLPEQALRQIEALMTEKAQRTPVQQKISSRLLHEAKIRRGEAIADGVAVRRAGVEVDSRGLVSVDIRTEVTPTVLQQIAEIGGVMTNSVPGYRAIRARVPLDRVEAIAALPEVRSVAPADQMITNQTPNAGSLGADRAATDPFATNKVNTSQGDVAHRAALTRTFYGVNGAGIGIGVLSNGVDTLASRQASGDVGPVTVLSGQAGSGDEGTAMLEIVYDLAPGANLLFATAVGGEAQFATNIQALCTAGARVIVDDVFYLSEAVFQDGTVAQGVNAAVANGCFHFSSAGNSGNLNDSTAGVWEGDYVAAASTPPGTFGGTAHDFGGGNTSNQITQDTANGFVLQWSDALGGSSNDYDLYLFDPTLTTVFASSTNSQTGTQDPLEFISSGGFSDLNNRLVIVRFSGAGRYLHLNTKGGGLAIRTAGQTAGHAAAANAFGVAAVNVGTTGGGPFTGGSANPVETYSSDGPRRIFFNPNGTAITPDNFSSTGGTLLQKPDLAAADCVATATPGFTTFCGTSAAAPHAGAMAALMLQAAGGPSSLTLSTMRSAINARALDIEAAGTDRDSGVGIFDALGAVGRTHPPFTDSTLTAGATAVRAVHVTQLRNRIDAQRVRCGLSAFSWTDPTLTVGASAVRAVHILEPRTALNAAYTACGMTPPTYTDPTLTAGSTPVKAIHITELRSAVIALE